MSTQTTNLKLVKPDTNDTADITVINSNMDIIDAQVANKVDKVSGKGLSTNDYTSTEKTKLAGIATGAQVNQNAFSNIKVGTTTVSADSTTDTLELVAGTNITLTPDATNDKITITAAEYTHPSSHPASMITAADGTTMEDFKANTETQMADFKSQAAGKGASLIGVQDANNRFTGTNVEAVLNELFQFANDGKTAVANAVTAKGVSASSADTFAALATKIGQINLGRKWASGTVTSSSSSSTFAYLNGATTMYSISIAGLAFKPSLVLAKASVSGKEHYIIYEELTPGIYAKTARISIYNSTANSSDSTFSFKGDDSAAKVLIGNIVLPSYVSNTSYTWIAIE